MSGFEATAALATGEADGDGAETCPADSFCVSSISSGETWGTTSLVGTIAPTSIDSAEAWGTPWLAPIVTYLPVSRADT